MSAENVIKQMDIMPIHLQRKAVNFSVCFLREEVESLKSAVELGVISKNIKVQSERRLAELEADLKIFEELNDKYSI